MEGTGWVIEKVISNSASFYWTGEGVITGAFSVWHEHAVRFARQEDADKVINGFFSNLKGLKSTEYGWADIPLDGLTVRDDNDQTPDARYMN